MDPRTLLLMELDQRRTDELFRRGRTWMACILGGSTVVTVALILRIGLGM